MAEQYLIYDETLTNIGNTIRSKYDDDTTMYYPKVMPSAIRGIPSGGDWRSLVERNIQCVNDRSGLISSFYSTTFAHCYSLDNLTLNGITSFGTYFELSNYIDNISNIRRLSFKNLVSYGRGSWCFSGLYNLEYINFGALSSVANNTFADCTSLKSVILSVCSYIGNGAFAKCTSLEIIRLMSDSIVSIPNGGILPVHSDYKIYVPFSLLEDYKTTLYWSYFSNQFVGE